MTRSKSFGLAAGVLIACSVFTLSLLGLGQARMNLSGSSNCSGADFDANLEFVNGPGDYFEIVVNRRNISSHRCVFDGPMYGPSVVPDRVPGNEPIALCYDCESRRMVSQVLTLESGEVVRQTFRWRTTPQRGVPCVQPNWMFGPVLVVAPSLLRQICSRVEVSGFSRAISRDFSLNGDPPVDEARAPWFNLTSDKSAYYKGEYFSLHLSLGGASLDTPQDEGCPTLYLRQRSPDGATRIDEVRPLAFKGCQRNAFGHPAGDWHSGFELDSGANTRWEGLGEHTMQVLQLAGSPEDAQVHFVASNVLRVQLADPATIERKWGPRVKGIATDITLDKDTFLLGEDVHLHLAVENFDAEVPVYGEDPLWDPCAAIGIEVQGSEGRQLGVNERFPQWSICTGHGVGPRTFAKGQIVPLERTLGTEGWLPNRPGIYTIVVTWATCSGSENASSNRAGVAAFRPYAIARAVSTINIVSGDARHPD